MKATDEERIIKIKKCIKIKYRCSRNETRKGKQAEDREKILNIGKLLIDTMGVDSHSQDDRSIDVHHL